MRVQFLASEGIAWFNGHKMYGLAVGFYMWGVSDKEFMEYLGRGHLINKWGDLVQFNQ